VRLIKAVTRFTLESAFSPTHTPVWNLKSEVVMAEQPMPVQTRHPKNVPTTERRAWVRLRSEQAINSQQDEAIYTWSGSIKEVSPDGITLSLRQPFEVGTVLNVELAPKAAGPRCLAVRVVRATQTEGHWIIGCAFRLLLSKCELQTLLED
jgi:PilZ domain